MFRNYYSGEFYPAPPHHQHYNVCFPFDPTHIYKKLEELEDKINDLENKIDGLEEKIDDLKDYTDNALNSILNKIYVPSDASSAIAASSSNPAGVISDDGTILWKNTANIPTGDLNVWAAEEDPWSTNYANAIRSRDRSENDLKVV